MRALRSSAVCQAERPHAKRQACGLQAPFAGQVAVELAECGTPLLDVGGTKPQAALARLREQLPQNSVDREAWRKRARVTAVMGSCPRSLASFKSGLRHWLEFLDITHGPVRASLVAMPPQLDDVLAWSNTFRCVADCHFNCIFYIACGVQVL